MNQSPAWLRIVQFVRDSLGYGCDSVSHATGISSTTLYDWCHGRVVPSVRLWSLYLQWALSLGAVRNHSADGLPWAWQACRLSDPVLSWRHQIFLLHSFDRWLLAYFYDGDLVEVDEGAFVRGQTLEQLGEELAELSLIRAREIEIERRMEVAS